MQKLKLIISVVFGLSMCACSSNRAPVASANNPVHTTPSTQIANAVFFNFNSAELPASAAKIITLNAGYLLSHSQSRVQIQGNSSEVGGNQYNHSLAQNRALAVKAALLRAGVNPAQVSVVSFGNRKPAYPNNANGQQPKNQRVDIVYTALPPYQYQVNRIPMINRETMY